MTSWPKFFRSKNTNSVFDSSFVMSSDSKIELQPPQTLSFKDAFWGTEFISYRGYDNLHSRMKDAKSFTDDFDSFIKQRASIEESYGKALVKLAKSSGGQTETGTMKMCWDVMKAETEAIGQNHLATSKKLLNDIDRPNRGFRDGQRDFRKRIEDDMKKCQKVKTNAYNTNVKAKKTYESKCRESEKADEEVARASGVVVAKELEKLRSKARKAKAAAEAADIAYQDAVKSLDEVRLLWETEMENLCIHFQRMEEERLDFLRNQMWLYTNICSEYCVKDDEHQETLRLTLEKCDVDADIQNFIKGNMTGTERPAPVPYVNFYAPANAEMQSQRANSVQTLPGSTPKSPSSTSIRSTTSQISVASSEPSGNSPPDESDQSASTGLEAEALFDYEAQGPLELTLRTGNRIRNVKKEDDTWLHGRIGDREGVFPANFVKLLGDPSSNC